MKLAIDHIAVVVKDLEESASLWKELFNLGDLEVENIKDRGVRVIHVPTENGPALEIMSPLGESSPVKKFLEQRGEGLHHICLRVEDIEKTMAEFKRMGLRLIQDQPVSGSGGHRVAFVHPDSLNGILIELKE